MKNGRIAIVGIVITLFIVTFLFINNNSSSKGKVSDVKSVVSSEEMENFLYGDKSIMVQVQNELSEKGYVFRTLISAYSKEDIQMEIILSNIEATEAEQKKVKSIFYEFVEKNNLDPNTFTLKVSDSIKAT